MEKTLTVFSIIILGSFLFISPTPNAKASVPLDIDEEWPPIVDCYQIYNGPLGVTQCCEPWYWYCCTIGELVCDGWPTY